MSMTKGKISGRNKEYTNNRFEYQREERIQISSTKEMGHRVVSGVSVGACGVIGPAYKVAVGLHGASSNSRIEAGRGRFGKTRAAVVQLCQLEGE